MVDVSVIIPTFNYGRYISESIESVLAQTVRPREIIVVDDGSTDDTEAIVKRYRGKVIYLKQKNSGVSAARNEGVRNSTGNMIAFLDADDKWFPEKLEKQLSKFQQDPEVGLVHCGKVEFCDQTGISGEVDLAGGEGWIAESMLLWKSGIVAPGSSVVFKREVFEHVGGYDPRLKNGEDWEFCLRVAREYPVAFVPEPLVEYRIHGSNAHLNIGEMERSTLIAWEKVFRIRDDQIQDLKRQSYGTLHKVLAGSYLHNREYGGFLRNLIKSLWYRPSYFWYYLKSLRKRTT